MTGARVAEIAPGESWASELATGETLAVTAQTVASLVCINAVNRRERFDQARTKVYNMKIWATAGDALYSKLNNPLMTIMEDGFQGTGLHDLQYPGCGEALAAALVPWGVEPWEVPQPFNLFHHVETDTRTGLMTLSSRRPAAPVTVRLRAETGLIVALAACVDTLAPGGPLPVLVATGGA